MNYRSPLARAKTYGSTRQGTTAWLWQRITALLLIPFVLALAFVLVKLPRLDYATARHWVADPVNELLLSAAILLLTGHVVLGLATVIEDYVHHSAAKFSLLLLTRFGFLLLGLAALQALWHIATVSTQMSLQENQATPSFRQGLAEPSAKEGKPAVTTKVYRVYEKPPGVSQVHVLVTGFQLPCWNDEPQRFRWNLQGAGMTDGRAYREWSLT